MGMYRSYEIMNDIEAANGDWLKEIFIQKQENHLCISDGKNNIELAITDEMLDDMIEALQTIRKEDW